MEIDYFTNKSAGASRSGTEMSRLETIIQITKLVFGVVFFCMISYMIYELHQIIQLLTYKKP